MKIIDIEVIELRVPGWTGETFDGSYDNCLVLVHTDEGMTGIAEVDSVPAVIRAIVDAPRSHTHAMGLKQVLLGQDPSDVEGLWDRMYDLTSYYGRRGVVIHAISAVDIALWDLRGKMQGKSLGRLLGAPQRDRVLAYGTVYPLGETPDEVRKTIDRGLKLGLKAIKIVADPFWRDDLAKTEGLIRAAREHVGPDIRLMVDAATAWSRAEEGLPLMPIFKDNDFHWVEAPLPIDDLDGHARFQGFGIPIGGGDLGLTTRYEYEEAFVRGKIDIAQPDVTMAGGITELMRIAGLAREARPARGHAWLQVEHHHRRQPRLPVAALDGRALRILHQPVAAALGAHPRDLPHRPGRSDRRAGSSRPRRVPQPGDGREIPDRIALVSGRPASARQAPR